MAADDERAGRPGDQDQEARIAELKERARVAAGGSLTSWESDALPPDLREQFWRRVMAFEDAPDTTLTKELVASGVELPEPDSLEDGALTTKLWDVIRTLGRMRVLLSETDHLSDRELYTHLWRDLLPEEMPALDDDPQSVWHIQILGTGSEEHTRLYLKHYADEAFREHWRKDFPDFEMPAHEDPAYDRDRHLPVREMRSGRRC